MVFYMEELYMNWKFDLNCYIVKTDVNSSFNSLALS